MAATTGGDTHMPDIETARFISKHAHYRLILRGELRGADTLMPGGTTQKNIVKGPLEAEFRLLAGITRYEQEYAYRHFAGLLEPRLDGTEGFIGADPSRSSDPIYNDTGAGPQLVGTTLPFDIRHHFSLYDTSWIEDEDDRVFALQAIRSAPVNGYAFVEIVAAQIPAPWPTYDDIKQGATMEIPSLTKRLGLSPVEVARYEAAHLNRPGVLDALAKLLGDVQAEKADEDALERVIQ